MCSPQYMYQVFTGTSFVIEKIKQRKKGKEGRQTSTEKSGRAIVKWSVNQILYKANELQLLTTTVMDPVNTILMENETGHKKST